MGKQRRCNACHEAPELASSRDELLEKYGKVKFQLESGIDEASAFFKLTKAAVMQHDETCKLFWLSICAKMMKSREKRSAFVLSEEWRNFQDYHQHPTGQFHNQFVSRSPLHFFQVALPHYLASVIAFRCLLVSMKDQERSETLYCS